MSKSPAFAAFIALPILTACASVPEERIAVPRAEAPQEQRIAHASVAIRSVALPSYASGETIFTADEAGRLRETPGLLWADDPSRAMTLEVTRHLAQITGARIAPEPWPFLDNAAAEVDIRVEEMLARTDGTFRLSGQYFVTGETDNERARLFDLAVPIPAEHTPEDIAAARGQVVRDLAVDIARRGLR